MRLMKLVTLINLENETGDINECGLEVEGYKDKYPKCKIMKS